jgi:hypothetical protein
MSRSTVLTGATTIKGMLCLAARTAALYVPIYSCEFENGLEGGKGKDLVGRVAVLDYPVCADSCENTMSAKGGQGERYWPTAWMVWCWNREPTMVSQIITEGILSVCSSRAVSLVGVSSSTGKWRSSGHTAIPGGMALFGCSTQCRGDQIRGGV